jgi:hypothetical protein
MDEKVVVTIREAGSAPIEKVEIPGGNVTLGQVMEHISRYHGNKTYTGKQLMIDGVEGKTATVVNPGIHEIFVGDDVTGGWFKRLLRVLGF